MFNTNRLFFVLVMLLSGFVFTYDEIKSLRDVENYIGDNPSETLLFLDIDDTIAVVPSNFGGDVWFSGALEVMHKNTGWSYSVCLLKLLPMYFAAQMKSSVVPVEADIVEILELMKKSVGSVFCLTTRGTFLADNTIRHLSEIGLHFNAPDGSSDEVELSLPTACTTKSGMIFCGDTGKGDALKAFLDRFGLKPKKIIFVDDKAKYLNLVDAVCDKLGIEFVGLRLSAADDQKEAFDFEDGAQLAKKFVTDLGWNCHMGFAE